jgi:hypothetical protein
MMNRLRPLIALSTVMTALTAAWAAAQTPAQSNFVGRGTELGGSLSAATTSSETAPAINGTVGWGMTRWVTIEARGAWFVRGNDANGIGGDVGARVNLFRRRQTTPYVGLGFGLYRETVDTPSAEVSDFYRTRMQERAGITTTTWTFTDPAWRVSTGVNIIRHRNFSIRPEAAVILVHRHGITETITAIGVQLGYIFEDHPVTR